MRVQNKRVWSVVDRRAWTICKVYSCMGHVAHIGVRSIRTSSSACDIPFARDCGYPFSRTAHRHVVRLDERTLGYMERASVQSAHTAPSRWRERVPTVL